MKPAGPFCIAWTGCQFTEQATLEQIAALQGTNATFEDTRVTTIHAELAPTVDPVHQHRVIRLTCEPISADPERLRAVLADRTAPTAPDSATSAANAATESVAYARSHPPPPPHPANHVADERTANCPDLADGGVAQTLSSNHQPKESKP